MPDKFEFSSRLIESCQFADVPRLQKALAQCKRQSWSGDRRDRLRAQIQASIDRTQARDALVRPLHFADLPVSDRLDEIQGTFERHQVIIVSGETGSGKTTQLPKMALQAGRGRRGLIGHTQPRRIAARSVAQRIAEECGYQLGSEVGYKVRFHDHTQSNTLIKLMTDGILLAEIRTDPQLRAYDTLIIDEAHERSLNTDFLLGYLKWLLPKRPDLKLIITSATIDTKRFAAHFKAPVIDVSGRSYPVECRYRPLQDADQGASMDLHQGIVDGVQELKREGSGDILVFLPGERDIRDALDVLRKEGAIARDYDILTLYGRLSSKDQARIFQVHSKRRIVLATNVAETSLTVPGIRYVIDSGLARVSRYSLRSKIQRLPIEPVSQASANQRAGRCGRVAPGVCIRLYDEDDFDRREPFTEAEILRVNLASVILQMKHLNLGNISNFPFLEPPEPKALRNGVRLLEELSALNPKGRLTAVGKIMAKFPIEPRLARILVEAQRRHSLTEACVLVAALSIQDPRERPSDKGQKADQAQAVFVDERSDFLSLLNVWQAYQVAKKQGSRSALRRFCRDHFLSWLRMNEWEEVWRQIVRIASRELKLKLNHEPADYQAIHTALLAGLLSHIGFKQDGREYQGARNLRFYLFPGSGVFKKPPKWIVAAEQVETSRVYGRKVAAVEPAWVETCAAHLVKRSYSDPHWSRKQGRAMVAERQTLFGLTLVQGRQVALNAIDAASARELFIRSALVEQDFHCRAAFYSHNQKLLEAAGYVEHKHRRVDLVVDAQWLFEFYDQRIPTDVFDARSFERWLKEAEKDAPKLLFLEQADLLRSNAQHLPADEFPDALSMDGLSVPLSYRFAPGAEDDGVTALVEIHQLNQFDPGRASWLVPGLLREKVIQLLRSLPKPVRKSLGPIPDVADRFLAAEHNQQRLLSDELLRLVRIEAGERGSLQLAEQHLEPHLRMNIRLLDGKKVVEETRDLGSLLKRYADRASSHFADQVEQPSCQSADLSQWKGEGLPLFEVSTIAGGEMRVYPALSVVQDNQADAPGVVVATFDVPESAHASHLNGLMNLLQTELKSELKYLKKHLKPYQRLDMLVGQLARHPKLAFDRQTAPINDEICTVAMEAVFLADADSIRSQHDFQEVLGRKSTLIGTCNELADLLEKILKSRLQIVNDLSAVQGTDASKQDIQGHLDSLVYAGFYQDTPMDRLTEYPRYLRALQKRLERLRHHSGKDDSLVSDAQVFEKRYWNAIQAEGEAEQALKRAQKTDFRWLLEEYRIALFAQPMKTRVPISAKRMTKAWSEYESNV